MIVRTETVCPDKVGAKITRDSTASLVPLIRTCGAYITGAGSRLVVFLAVLRMGKKYHALAATRQIVITRIGINDRRGRLEGAVRGSSSLGFG